MSAGIRGHKRPIIGAEHQLAVPDRQASAALILTRIPLRPAAVSLASMMLMGTAAAQNDNTANQSDTSAAPKATSAASQGTVALPPIDVRANRPRPQQRPATNTSSASIPAAAPADDSAARSYQAPTTSGLSRVPTPLRDTPQSVNVVPQQVIRDQAVADVKDALRNVAGVTFRAGEGGNQGDTPYIRGFSAQNDVFRDGMRDPGWYTRDAFATDAVEVYKGPSSVLFGRGSTGGAVNLITKLPQDRNVVEGTITGNTGPGARATVDANGTVDNISSRVVITGQRYDIPDRDHVEVNRFGFAPSLKMKLGAQTTTTFSYIYQHDNNIPDYGVPFMAIAFGNPRPIAPVPRNTWYGILSGPTPDVERLDAHVLTNKFEHAFNNGLTFVNSTRYTYVDHFQRNVFPEPAPTSLALPWTPNRAQVAVINTMIANNSDLIAKFHTGPFQHTAVAGIEVNRETRDFLRNNFAGMASTDLFNPDPWHFGGVALAPTTNQLLFGRATDAAAYAADQIKLNQYFEILGSARIEQYRFAQDAPLAAANVQHLERTDNLFSWRVGVVYHPLPLVSLYVMRGTSFNPSADNLSISVSNPTTALSLANIPPEQNKTTEAGIKADVLGSRLSLASAVFHTEKTNLRVPDPTNSAVTILDGVVRADGFEASVSGKLTEQWQIIASYTYVHARVVKSSVALQVGAEPTNTPTHAFSLWTTYDVTPKVQAGFGAFYTGEVYGDFPASATSNPQSALVPDWWRFDAMAAYKINDQATLQLNIYNLTDKFYYTSAYTNWAVPASGRTAALTLRVKY